MAATSFGVDLLAIGGGMAGMTAAAYAARHGARVVVVEKAAEIGGSAVLSAGGFAVPTTAEDLMEVNPTGDPVFARLLREGYDAAVEWTRSLGVAVTDPNETISSVLGFRSSVRGIDVIGYIDRCKDLVTATGGWVVTGCTVQELLTSNGRVCGARVEDRDGESVVDARWTLIATGGFQNDPDMRAQYLGEQARSMLTRSNPTSAGAGIRLALSVGGVLTEPMNRFYGHTIPAPLNHPFTTRDYVRLAQPILSPNCVLLDRHGRRFTDESSGYYRSAQTVLVQEKSRALLVGDQRIREMDTEGGAPSKTLGYERVDRPSEARRSGAHVAEAKTLAELERLVASWGYQGVERAIIDFNEALAASDATMDPPRRRNRQPISTPPFFAIEIQPVITNTWGGISVDADAHVLNRSGDPIPGLLAAGADAGGAYHEAYSGGLILACILGMRGARVVISDLIPMEEQSPSRQGAHQDSSQR